MSFLTVVATDAQVIENDAVSAAKTLLNYVDNVVVTDLIPALEAALQTAIGNLGQEAVAAILGAANVPAPVQTPAA